MTDREKTIVTAYTGVTMLQGEKLDLLYAYVSELLGFPVQTLDFVYMADKIQKLSKPDFIKLCAEDTERPRGEWKFDKDGYFSCSCCKKKPKYQVATTDFCPHCGASMIKEEAKAIGAGITKEWGASCENCEHAYRGADPLKIIQDSKHLFYCAAGHAYGGSETVCSEWKRKEGDAE